MYKTGFVHCENYTSIHLTTRVMVPVEYIGDHCHSASIHGCPNTENSDKWGLTSGCEFPKGGRKCILSSVEANCI